MYNELIYSPAQALALEVIRQYNYEFSIHFVSIQLVGEINKSLSLL